MSSSIAIPKRKNKMHAVDVDGVSSASSSSSSLSHSMNSPRTPQSSSPMSAPSSGQYGYYRRPSLLSSSISKSEHIVINVGHPDAPRLITCVKASQGFDWNQEIFLPSYCDHNFGDLERKQDPVQDIIVTDEEIASMFP